MSRTLSARQTELTERRALTPVPLLKLTTYTDREAQTGGVDRYFSDRPLQYDYGNTGTLRDFAPDLLGVDPLERLMVHLPRPDTPGDQVRRLAVVEMRNAIDALGKYLIDELRGENLEGAVVELAELLVDRNAGEALQGDRSDLVGDEHLVWFRGQVQLVSDTSEDAFTLTLRSIVPFIDAPILNTPATNDPKDLGVRLNQVYGECKKVPCHGVEVGGQTTIAQRINATETPVIDVTSTLGFPAVPSGFYECFIANERVQLETGSNNTMALAQRGVGGTTAAAHAAGDVIIEVGVAAIFEVAGHECNAVDAVYVVNPFNQELVRIRSALLGTVSLADTTSISGETITSVKFTDTQVDALYQELLTSGGNISFGLRLFADVKGYEVPAADTNYDAAAGALIEKLPDIIRHYIVERAGGAHADCDSTSWAATLTDLGANKHNFVEAELGGRRSTTLEQVFALLGWEGRTQILQVEQTAGTVYKLLAANNPSAGTYDWDASLSTLENYQDATEQGDSLDNVFTRWRFAFDRNRSALVIEEAFEAVLQCDPNASDIAGITTTEMSNAEKAFGRRDHAGVFLLTISDENTAEDVAGYYVVESTRAKVIAHIVGVPWVEAYPIEIGDIRDALLPWWPASKDLRITRYVKNWDTELIDVSGVEVP